MKLILKYRLSLLEAVKQTRIEDKKISDTVLNNNLCNSGSGIKNSLGVLKTWKYKSGSKSFEAKNSI